jgi:hypothetical protein
VLGGGPPPGDADVHVVVDGRDVTAACSRRVDLAWPPRRVDLVYVPPAPWAAGAHEVRVEGPAITVPAASRFTVM